MSEEIKQDVEDVVVESNGTEPSDEVVELSIEERLAAAELKSAENLEGWQRAVADFSNARKRFEKQRLDARSNATIDIVTEILPVLDDLTLVMANVPEAIAQDEWFKGLEMIPRKLNTILERIKIEKVDAVGHPFDPTCHNAIQQEESDEYESGVIIKEYQAGYKIGDRVIRPAVVAVAA